MVVLILLLFLVSCAVMADIDEGGCLGELAGLVGVLILLALAVRFAKWIWFLEV